MLKAKGLDETMRDKSAGLLQGLLFFKPGLVAVVLRSKTAFFLKQHAEGTNAFEPDIITDLGNSEVITRQPLPGLFHSFTGEVLVWRPLVNTGEEPVEMET